MGVLEEGGGFPLRWVIPGDLIGGRMVGVRTGSWGGEGVLPGRSSLGWGIPGASAGTRGGYGGEVEWVWVCGVCVGACECEWVGGMRWWM